MLLKKQRKKYSDLCHYLKISEPTVKRMLNNDSKLSLDYLLEICEFLNINLADLYELTQNNIHDKNIMTLEHEDFLAKNNNHFLYFLDLFQLTPKEIQKKYSFEKVYHEKIMRDLEREGLIQYSQQGNLQLFYDFFPFCKPNGPLSIKYGVQNFERFSAFMAQELARMFQPNFDRENTPVKSFVLLEDVMISAKNYKVWLGQMLELLENLRKMSNLDQKLLPTESLSYFNMGVFGAFSKDEALLVSTRFEKNVKLEKPKK